MRSYAAGVARKRSIQSNPCLPTRSAFVRRGSALREPEKPLGARPRCADAHRRSRHTAPTRDSSKKQHKRGERTFLQCLCAHHEAGRKGSLDEGEPRNAQKLSEVRVRTFQNTPRYRGEPEVIGKQLSRSSGGLVTESQPRSEPRGQNDAKSRAQMCTRIDRAHSFRFAAQY